MALSRQALSRIKQLLIWDVEIGVFLSNIHSTGPSAPPRRTVSGRGLSLAPGYVDLGSPAIIPEGEIGPV